MNAEIQDSFYRLPVSEGPIPVTEKSHPFCSMAMAREALDLGEYGFLEEEYFLAGTANVYDLDEQDEAYAAEGPLPYKTRIIVRKPADPGHFSGRVYLDIMNATQGYDIEDLWHRTYLWCMEHGHGYVGITSKPVNVMSLKNYDYDRYHTLNWSSGKMVEMPTVSDSATLPGTEEGLIWDMLGQTGMWLRSPACAAFAGYDVKEIYLTGQSQSGAYLNTFISYFDRSAKRPDGTPVFDGYMNIVGALVQRSIRQENSIGPLRLLTRNMHPSTVPYICLSSEADLTLFRLFVEGELLDMRVENADSEENKCRYYEIPGSPHTDILCPVLCAVSEIERMNGKVPDLRPELVRNINDMHIEYYVCGLLEKLHEWAVKGTAPSACEVLARKDGKLLRDRHGNSLGGLRTPYVDVPIASYEACNPEDPEGICGRMEYFSAEKFRELYGDAGTYRRLFAESVDRQVAEGWLTPTDGGKMKAWSVTASKRYESCIN